MKEERVRGWRNRQTQTERTEEEDAHNDNVDDERRERVEK